MVDIDYAALTNAIIDAVPADVFLWMKFAMMAVVVFFLIMILKNIFQIGTAYRSRKTLKTVLSINKKIDSIIRTSVVTPEEEQTDEYNYQ